MYIPKGFNADTLRKYPKLHDFYQRLGETPIIEIDTPSGHGRIFAKCEWNHPAGTIKAKVALAMVWRLLDKLDERLDEITILEYSGGGLSMALAELCYELGVKCVLVLMQGTPDSILDRLHSLQAEVVLSDKKYGFYGVMEKGMALSAEHPDWKFLYQHQNWANFDFHSEVTAREITDVFPDSIDAWVASIGTGGTLTGVYNGLKAHHPNLRLYTNMPAEMPYGSDGPSNSLPKFSGSGGLGCGRKQKFVERVEEEIVAHHLVSFQESKQAMLDFYRSSGLMIGSSAAANLLVAYRIAEELGEDATVMTVFPSAALPEEQQEILNKAAAYA
ncbi:MAG: pyridoxal-phosphate dependent enzyme [Bacteroidota bacterium]